MLPVLYRRKLRYQRINPLPRVTKHWYRDLNPSANLHSLRQEVPKGGCSCWLKDGTPARRPTTPFSVIHNNRGYCCHILCARWELLLHHLRKVCIELREN